MPIDNVAPRLRELGRLKFGEDLGDRPTQLTTWRLTSPNLDLIEAAARLWGGSPAFKADGSAGEVVTETGELECLVPLQDVAAGQWWEHWTAGGLQRRCSGTSLVEYDEHEPDGWRKVAPCVCDEENGPRLCKPTTVLRVLLPQLPDLGVWRLTTRSLYAAQELPVAVGFLLGSHPDRTTAPAVLGLDQRTQKKAGQKPHHFTVPVLRTRTTLEALGTAGNGPAGELSSGADQGRALDSLPASTEPGPGPENLPAPAPSAADSEPLSVSGSSRAETPPSAHTGEPGRSARLVALDAFLESIDPGDLPAGLDELTLILETLERLAVDAGVWKPGALDQASGKWLDRPWRECSHGYQLRTFTQRAVLAVLGERSHP